MKCEHVNIYATSVHIDYPGGCETINLDAEPADANALREAGRALNDYKSYLLEQTAIDIQYRDEMFRVMRLKDRLHTLAEQIDPLYTK